MSKTENGSLEASTMKAVLWRLIPFVMLLYFIAYLDRVNIGFAALTMNADLGFSATVYGLGAGIFFIGYALFEVPSNIFLHKLGARVWIARIMITWGLLSGAMAFVTNPTSFYIIRFLLGAAEAGFFPGIILYLTYWFPAKTRGKAIGLFMVSIPLSAMIGAPISSALLGLDWLSMRGWQWMFILEAIPAVILGIVTIFYLTDRPEQAKWLSPGQRDWLSAKMAAERGAIANQHGEKSLKAALMDKKVLGFAFIYFCVVLGSYTLGFWLPQMIKSFGEMSNFHIGLATAGVNMFGVVAMIYWTRRSDARQERLGHFAFAVILAAIGFGVCAATLSTPIVAVIALTFAGMGIFSALPTFWALPTTFLTGVGAAAGIALINSIGNLAGYLGPFVMGYLKDQTGSYSAGLVIVSALLACGALSLLFVTRMKAPSANTQHPA
ncbi:MFS transporter [Agrobacterium cavarae]|nr:MFS transporter [Agrobacterium cavarae]